MGSFGRDHELRSCFRFRLPKNGTPRHLAIIAVVGSVAFVLGEQRISLGGSARRRGLACPSETIDSIQFLQEK